MARKRALGRRMDPQTGVVYHLEFDPPPEEHEPGLNERLVPVEGAADREASLPAALVAYTDGEAAMAEWFEGFGILAPVAAEEAVEAVGAAVSEALATSLVAKEERLAAKKAFEDEQAAAAAAAEAEAAAAEEERLAAEKAAEEEGAEAPAAVPPPPAAAPAALLPEASESLYADWKTLEDGFLTEGSTSLATVRSLQWRRCSASARAGRSTTPCSPRLTRGSRRPSKLRRSSTRCRLSCAYQSRARPSST